MGNEKDWNRILGSVDGVEGFVDPKVCKWIFRRLEAIRILKENDERVVGCWSKVDKQSLKG